MPHPPSILAVLDSFRPEFTPRTWARVITLILGTILARGRRTVAAALRQMGLHDAPDFRSYHQVFNRSAWSPLRLARRLLSAVIAAFVPPEEQKGGHSREQKGVIRGNRKGSFGNRKGTERGQQKRGSFVILNERCTSGVRFPYARFIPGAGPLPMPRTSMSPLAPARVSL